MAEISAVVITRNEEANIEECLSKLTWADEIVVVDACSSDGTVELAKKFTDKVVQREFDNYSSQKNFAMDQATKEWVFFADADERIAADLADEIRRTVDLANAADGYRVPRRTCIFGRELHHGGHGIDAPMRLFRRAKARFYQPVHEEVRIDGTTGELTNFIQHLSSRTVSDYFAKFNQYTDLEAQFMRDNGKRVNMYHILVKPWLKFCWHYFFKLGFLDGWNGFLFDVFSAYYTFVKHVKCYELQRK